jgi:hypothetical protein
MACGKMVAGDIEHADHFCDRCMNADDNECFDKCVKAGKCLWELNPVYTCPCCGQTVNAKEI